ncbi:MAG: hypothetical protein WC711_03245 [Candidatus Staskawiczbacteria bacterium]|jgi:hypothetical protein
MTIGEKREPQREESPKPVEFWISERDDLSASIDKVFTAEEYKALNDDEKYDPGTVFRRIIVASEEDKKKYLELLSEQLSLSWASNQGPEEITSNKPKIASLKEQMRTLEEKAMDVKE